MINVTIIAKNGKSLAQEIMIITEKLSNKHTKTLANASEEIMKNNIQESILRNDSTGNLAKQITVEELNNGYGVGNIDTLNQNAKQWAWLNWGRAQTGRTIPPGTKENPRIRGHFTSPTRGRFIKGQPKFPMNPKQAIRPINYIEKTLATIQSRINEFLLGI
jgi:hypothetical protein